MREGFHWTATVTVVFGKDGAQYLKLMTLGKGKRLVIPLFGAAAIVGNIRVVVDKQGSPCSQDTTELFPRTDGTLDALDKGDSVSFDRGYTDVGRDDLGSAFGKELGHVLTYKGEGEDQLHAREKKFRDKGEMEKSCDIRKFNLGQIKQQK